MKNRNVKVVDDHNIDRNANVMFALDLEGSEYVVYWIERDETSNNVFVSKVLKNIDGTYNMINIDDDDKKRDVSDTVKMLISNAVSDQNDKLIGTMVTLSNGKIAKFIDVSFNKEQNINVSKTYITTVKKEVTKVAEDYYDVIVEEAKVEDVLPSVTPVVETVTEVFPELGSTTTPVVETPVIPQPVATPASSVVEDIPVVAPVIGVQQPVQPVAPEVVVPSQPQVVSTSAPVVEVAPAVQPVPQQPAVSSTPVVDVAQVVQPVVVEPIIQNVPQQSVVPPTPVAAAPIVTPEVVPTPVVETNQTLVFDATKETNLNAALGEVANSAAIPVENITPVREFGVEEPAVQPVVQSVVTNPINQTVPQQPTVAPMVQPEVASVPKTLTKKAGFANSKFFMVIAVAFFLASCVFLGYEVFKYFQLTK